MLCLTVTFIRQSFILSFINSFVEFSLLPFSQNSLQQLQKAIKGLVVMSLELDCVYNSFINNQVSLTLSAKDGKVKQNITSIPPIYILERASMIKLPLSSGMTCSLFESIILIEFAKFGLAFSR